MNLTPKPTFELTQEQLEQLQSEDSYLRGTAALSVLNEAVKETGITIPDTYVFKDIKRESVGKALHAVFELTGGVPAMVLWASRTPTEFYRMWSKLAAEDNKSSAAATVIIQTNVPSSPLNDISIGTDGKVIGAKYDDRDDDELVEFV